MKSKIETTDAPLPGTSPHSQAVVASFPASDGGFVFTQGVICLVPETMKLIEGDTDMSLYADVNKVYGTYFEKGNYPARDTVCVKELPLGAQIEISMIAVKN